MAQFISREPDFIQSLTDCVKFINSYCIFAETCPYRHSFEARKQPGVCRNWPDLCRKIQCRFRHPATLPHPRATALNPSASLPSKNSGVSFFWDIENVPIPKGQRPFDIVQRIRQQLVIELGLQEIEFSCYCNSNSIPSENQQSLHHANVRIIHVPDRKPGAVDRQIMLDLDRFQRIHRPPATVVLISGDIDFVGKLSDLRHQARFHVIVIHNKPAKEELKATVNEHYPWELFTSEQSTSSNRKPHSSNNHNIYDNNSSQAIPRPSSRRGRSRTSTTDSRNNDNFVHRNTPASLIPPPPLMQQRQVDSLTSDINQPSFPVYYFNKDNNVPQYPSSSAMLPKTSEHRSTGHSHFEANPTTSHPIGRGANRTNRRKKRERNSPQDCPFCEAEFDTVQALRQHQENKSHLYSCPVCNQGFFTYEGQVQHQKAKDHDLSEDTRNPTEKYRNYRSRNNNQLDDEDNYTSDEETTVSSTNDAIEPVSTGVIVRGLIEIWREIFK